MTAVDSVGRVFFEPIQWQARRNSCPKLNFNRNRNDSVNIIHSDYSVWGLGTCHGQLWIFSAALAFTVNTASKLFKVAGEATIPNA
jgi:hypothetical protein